MNRVLVDDAVRSTLRECSTQTELCDKDGRVLGVYTPITDPDRKWYSGLKDATPTRNLNDAAMNRAKKRLQKSSKRFMKHEVHLVVEGLGGRGTCKDLELCD
jgi:hypothetical protein